MGWVIKFLVLVGTAPFLVSCGMLSYSMNKEVLSTLRNSQVLGQACDLHGMWDERGARLPYIYEAQRRGLTCAPAFFQKAEQEDHQMELLMLKENCLPGWIDKRTGQRNWKCQDWYDPSVPHRGFGWQRGAIMPPY